MPRRQYIDRKTATTYALVHRAQHDPLIFDENAPQMVFAEISVPGLTDTETETSSSIQNRHRLDHQYGPDFHPNEGQAAEHGIYYDDTSYDYMQHMRDLGTATGSVTWLEPTSKSQQKKKAKVRLEDALQDLDLDRADTQAVSVASSRQSLLPDDAFGSEFVMKRTYQDQQDVPDAIAGFQPDMDPRLREVLEALDDDAYVDDQDDIFQELAQDHVVDEDDWQDSFFGDDDDQGWESDATVKATHKPFRVPPSSEPLAPPEDTSAPPPEDATDGAWLAEFSKFKKDAKAGKVVPPAAPAPAADTKSLAPSQLTGLSSLASGRRKKRKGAKTSTTNYSMTSSALARTEAQTILDARFDKLMEAYDKDGLDRLDEEDNASMASGATGLKSTTSRMSRISNVSGLSRASGISSYSRASDLEAPREMRSDFDSIMDGFFDGHVTVGKKRGSQRVRQTGGLSGALEELDEARKALGPARISNRQKA